MVLATDEFVIKNQIDNKVRFDVVTCMPVNEDGWEIEHIEDAVTVQVE